ncbi:MAG: hypothetical protein JW803_01445 [Endomicrobiales bacterium]|nr:hypothetical protein [Endomicrobiales bacterium]
MGFERIFEGLTKHDVRYLIIGGMAVNLYGYDRITGDIDIMMSFDKENILKLESFMKEYGFKPGIPVGIEELADARKRKEWIEKKNAKVFKIHNPSNMMEVVDIMIMEYLDFEQAYERREYTQKGLKLPLISIDDLIKLKKIAGRERDKTDISALKLIKKVRDEKS